MRGGNKSYTNGIDVYLHFMLVVEVIKLKRILNLLMTVRWHLMLHIAMSNWFMDWQKYLKSKMSIRIQQPERLDSTNCHTFPGSGSRTLDILLHDSTLQFFCAKGFNWDTCPRKQFYCYTWLLLSALLVRARALAYFQVNLTPDRRLFWAIIADSNRQPEAGWRAAGPPICLNSEGAGPARHA